MKVRYINLEAATERRSHIEANFRELAPSPWSIVRVPATSSEDPEVACQSGRIRPSEKACFLSHRKAITASLEEPGSSMIVEDDVLFCPSSFDNIDKLEQQHRGEPDIVFTSVLIQEPANLVPQFLLRRQLGKNDQVTLIDLAPYAFVGADAYIVTARGKRALAALFRALTQLDAPYDIQLQAWVKEKKLKALTAFPFLTSLSAHADFSMNGNSSLTSVALNGFRRLLAFDRVPNPVESRDRLMQLVKQGNSAIYDQETDDFAQILRVLLARNVLPG